MRSIRIGRARFCGSDGWAGAVCWAGCNGARRSIRKNVYVAVSDLALRLAAEGTPGAQKSIYGPSLRPDPNLGGGLFALKLATGEVVWHTPHPAAMTCRAAVPDNRPPSPRFPV